MSHVTQIMYIERGGGLAIGGRVGRARLSKTGRTVYYGDVVLRSLNGAGYKTNHFDIETGEEYWVSRPRKDGNDPLYPNVVEIDHDARNEYWRVVRGQPENSHICSFRAPGKHSKRRQPDNVRSRAR
jgi:hypothetical protein